MPFGSIPKIPPVVADAAARLRGATVEVDGGGDPILVEGVESWARMPDGSYSYTAIDQWDQPWRVTERDGVFTAYLL